MARPRLDFKAIKEAADFEVILARTGLVTKREGAELLARCPFHEDDRPSFRANPGKKVFHCFGCGAKGNALDYVARHERLSIRQAAERIVEWCGLPVGVSDGARPTGEGENGTRTDTTSVPSERARPAPQAADATENHPLTFVLKLDPTHEYLRARGLTPDVVATFGLGYCSRGLQRGRICIPIENEHGGFVAYAGRYPGDTVPEGEPKYKLPAHFAKSAAVYNLHRVREAAHLTVVEGYWSVYRLHALGIPAVALMGSTLSPRQEELLALCQATRLTLFLDGDEAGRRGALEMLPRLAGRFFVRVADFGDNTQPDTLPDWGACRLVQKEESCP